VIPNFKGGDDVSGARGQLLHVKNTGRQELTSQRYCSTTTTQNQTVETTIRISQRLLLA
jgi:hypothetical protein